MSEGERFTLYGPVPGKVLAMTVFRGRLILATDCGVYQLVDGIWASMACVVPDEPRRSVLHVVIPLLLGLACAAIIIWMWP